jgi:hypothetical protein
MLLLLLLFGFKQNNYLQEYLYEPQVTALFKRLVSSQLKVSSIQ